MINLDRYPTSRRFKERGHDTDSIPEWSQLVEELVLKIHKAYANIPRPGVTLHVAREFDDHWTVSHKRGRELRALDPEELWNEVTDAAMEKYEEYFNFSDIEGWKFYLPAFMCHALRGLPSSASYSPAYQACKSLREAEALTPEQLECLHKFTQLSEICEKEEEAKSWIHFAIKQDLES